MSDCDPPHPAELCLQRAVTNAEAYVRREPAKAVAAALGAGLLIKLLPARAVVRPLSALAVTLLPPVLLGLGIMKAFELCCQQSRASAPVESAGEASA